MKKLSSTLLLTFSTLLIGACGSSSTSNDGTSTGTVQLGEATLANAAAPSGGAPAATGATTRGSETFGVAGNLWKPRSEEGSSSAGLLVVLLGAQHTGRFDTCEVRKRDGSIAQLDCNDRVSWTHTPFSCVANGGREHWRADFPCEEAAEARVVCRNFSEEVSFAAPGAAIGAVCARHG